MRWGLDPSERLLDADPRASRVPATMLWRVTGPLQSLLARGVARPLASGMMELFLDDEEATQGGMMMISMPVEVRCPSCRDGVPATPCARCAGARQVTELYSAWLAVPPGIPDGTVLAPSVDLPGMIRRPEFFVRRAS
jgi:hypothetical protein